MAEARVEKFPRDFFEQMFEGFEFLGKVGVDAVLLLAQVGAGESALLGKFIRAWEEMNVEKIALAAKGELEDFNRPTLEEAAVKSGLTYPKLMGALTETATIYGSNMGRIVLHTAMPRVMKRLADEAAMEDANVKKQELYARAVGVIDSGAKVQINNNNQVVNQGAGSQLPDWKNYQEVIEAGVEPRMLEDGGRRVEGEIIEVEELEEVRANNIHV